MPLLVSRLEHAANGPLCSPPCPQMSTTPPCTCWDSHLVVWHAWEDGGEVDPRLLISSRGCHFGCSLADCRRRYGQQNIMLCCSKCHAIVVCGGQGDVGAGYVVRGSGQQRGTARSLLRSGLSRAPVRRSARRPKPCMGGGSSSALRPCSMQCLSGLGTINIA